MSLKLLSRYKDEQADYHTATHGRKPSLTCAYCLAAITFHAQPVCVTYVFDERDETTISHRSGGYAMCNNSMWVSCKCQAVVHLDLAAAA
jgi:hypothetical protein